MLAKHKQRTSQAAKAGILFSVARTHRKLKAMPGKSRVSKLGSVYMTAVIEYLIGEPKFFSYQNNFKNYKSGLSKF
jgi:hypothetical protein